MSDSDLWGGPLPPPLDPPAAKKGKPNMPLPQFGTIKGGALAGCYFHVLRFVATPTTLRLLARVTPVAWPFPRDVEMRARDFAQLRRIPGSRAKTLNAHALIVSALTLEGIEPPDWLDGTKRVRFVLDRLDQRIRPLPKLKDRR